jgi:hypothetical protein
VRMPPYAPAQATRHVANVVRTPDDLAAAPGRGGVGLGVLSPNNLEERVVHLALAVRPLVRWAAVEGPAVVESGEMLAQPFDFVALEELLEHDEAVTAPARRAPSS